MPRRPIEKDLDYRRWNATHNGVYVEVTADSQPNPLLHVPEREITAPSGRVFTLVNPASMTRQVHAAEPREGGIHAKLTSLHPVNPANLPDAWEQAGLESFAAGQTEAMEIAWTDGQPCIRLMHPVYMEEMCMKCHGPQGVRAGDVRGAISVSVPAGFLLREEAAVNRLVLSGLGVVWLAGLLGVWLVGRHLCRRLAERRESMETLKESENRFRRLFEQSYDAIILSDQEGKIVDINGRCCEMSGYGRDELIGRIIYSLHPEYSETLAAKGRESIMEDAALGIESQCRRKDGSVFDIEVSSRLIDPSPPLILSVVRDITARKRSEAALVQAKQAAEAASRAKSEFLANVSHEIRTPLTAILGYTELLADPGLAEADCRAHAETIRRNGKVLLRLLDDILSLSKFDAAKVAVELSECSLCDTIDDVIALMRVRTSEKAVGLHVEYAYPLPKTIRTDSVRLRQILMNLIGNAIKFTERGTVLVTVSLGREPAGPPRIEFAVQDTGIGMTPEEASRCSNPSPRPTPPPRGGSAGPAWGWRSPAAWR